jgi:hypothetical protein
MKNLWEVKYISPEYKEVVLVPIYKREEYLPLCLEALRAADRTIRIVVFCDRGWAGEEVPICQICEPFGAEVVIQPCHAWRGNSYNVLKAYAWAVEQGYDRTYLVESDVIVKPDFFRWHRAVMEKNPKCPVSVGWYREGLFGNHLSYHLTTNYSSIGVCWRTEALLKVLKHLNYQYLQNLSDYCERVFKGQAYTGGGGEQDGLICAVICQEKWWSIYPAVARCRHIGWYGYNRGWKEGPSGTFEEKVQFTRSIMNDRTEMVKRLGEKDTCDMRMYPMDWKEGDLIQES